MSDKLKFKCRKCGQSLNASSSKAGQKLPCPACGASVKVPSPGSGTSTQDETVLFRAHPAMFRNRPVWFCIWVTAFVLCWSRETTWWISILAGIVLSIWYLRCLMATFTVTNKRTTLRTGILSKSINEVWHADVRNVQLSQSLMQRIFSVGTIGISSSGQSGVELTISGIGRPYKAKQIIDDCR